MTSTTQLGRNLADFGKGTRTETLLTLVGRQMLVAPAARHAGTRDR